VTFDPDQDRDQLPSSDGPGSAGPTGSRALRPLIIWMLLIAMAGIALFTLAYRDEGEVEERPKILTDWLDKDPSAFESAEIKDGFLHAELSAKTDAKIRKFKIRLQGDDMVSRYDQLMSDRLGERYKGIKKSLNWKGWVLPVVPWLVFLALMYFLFIRQIRNAGGGGGVLSFGKTRAKLIRKESSKVTFEDVAGMIEAKEEVLEIIEFLSNPSRFQRIGGRMPRGIMFIGPPGTGKTLLAKAIAGEADVPFYSISGSDFVEMFVGVGASRVRDLFRQAKQNSPCIIFLDEIDAVGRRRGTGFSGAHDEREQTLNAILVEMDGFETSDQVIVIAATNRPDVLDPALRRPGRFDREVMISLPDINEREAILKVHARDVRTDPAVDLTLVARGTPGFSGADLAALINESALAATMQDKDAVELADLEEARDKVRWGRSRRSRAMDENDKRISAYHEGGHALLTVLLQPDAEPLHKVTIIPRGPSLGATMFLPEKDRYLVRRKECLAGIMVSFGGRIAEELVFDDISSGAAMDIREATQTARRMVTEWGMSGAVGPIRYVSGGEDANGFGPEVFMAPRAYSDETAREIDEEVRGIVDGCYAKAKELLVQNRNNLEALAEALLAFEVLDAAEVQQIIAGQPLSRAAAGAASDGTNDDPPGADDDQTP